MPARKLRRNTPQRRVIHEELCRLDNHPTAAQIYTAVRARLPRISLGTVYRNLDVLHEDGMIGKLDFAGAETRFDGTTAPHCHVRCTGCGAIADVREHGVDLPRRPAVLEGFRVTGHRLEFTGLCPECDPGRPGPGH
jgi:Fur family ferric uptake transcriptional regulator